MIVDCELKKIGRDEGWRFMMDAENE